ncbi:unnamed protein product, partial [Discosporangium mesarthrocarpum]
LLWWRLDPAREPQGRYGEAGPMYKRALAILSAAVGENHPNYAATLNNLAELLCSCVRNK